MNDAADVYVHADKLDGIPELNRKNYEFETKLVAQLLPKNSSVLQVGSMDGMRAIRLLSIRPDLQFTGLEVEESLVKLAYKNVAQQSLSAKFILGDITNPPKFSQFDYVLCLNNTLGYIPDEAAAISNMKELGEHVFISVFGEKFTPRLAAEYFKCLGLKVVKNTDDYFILQDFTQVRRYTKVIVAEWSGKAINTPLGYFCDIR